MSRLGVASPGRATLSGAAQGAPRQAQAPLPLPCEAKATPARRAGLRRSSEDADGVAASPSPEALLEGRDTPQGSLSRSLQGTPRSVSGRSARPRAAAPPPAACVVGFESRGSEAAAQPSAAGRPPGLLASALRDVGGASVLLRTPDGQEDMLLCSLPRGADNPIFFHALVRKAFAVAKAAHDGQERKNGAPVLAHCVETARVLAQLGLDAQVVAAGLLHDCLDDTMLTAAQLEELFPESDVALLVDGVTRMSGLSQLHRDAAAAGQGGLPVGDIGALRAMLLSMADVRVVLIKLADRLHNLRTLGALPATTAGRMAAETLEIFCPLAARLGVWGLKAELEDLCFATLLPQEHGSLAALLTAEAEAADVAASQGALAAALAAAGVSVLELSGRPKNLYSTWRKMQRKRLPLSAAGVSQVLDARALRVIVPDEADCYAALAATHALWLPLDESRAVKDYVAAPKANGYRSLHAVVVGPDARALEVQIRTPEMHTCAEYGVAAHWRYKEGEAAAAAAEAAEEAGAAEGPSAESALFVEQQVAWARFLLSWESELCSESTAALASEHLAAAAARGCTFPTHSSSCAHEPAWPLQHRSIRPAAPAPAREPHAPLLVLLRDAAARNANTTLRVLNLPRAATVGHLRAVVGAALLKHSKALVNTQPRDDLCTADDDAPLLLASGDVLELLTDAAVSLAGGALDELAQERQRLMRTISFSAAPSSAYAPPRWVNAPELQAY